MYCEITVDHRKKINQEGLERAIRVPFGNDTPLATAYARSAIYGPNPPASSMFAFDTDHNCFVIARNIKNVYSSIYHLEGSTRAVTAQTMLQAAEEFSWALVKQLKATGVESGYRVRSLQVRLFEDNGRETGMSGTLVTAGSVFSEKLSWKEIKSGFIPFVTAMLLIWRGLKQEPWKASFYSFLIVLVFTLVEAIVSCWQESGKIKWKSR